MERSELDNSRTERFQYNNLIDTFCKLNKISVDTLLDSGEWYIRFEDWKLQQSAG
ncbi:MAG: hypothetical protein PUE83_09485 [Lachnobacterium sp.]|nr:hypothetical protein [Lachnobacterium sp.]